MRLYFYAATSIRVVHTFVFDGDQEKDFVRGLGVELPCRCATSQRAERALRRRRRRALVRAAAARRRQLRPGSRQAVPPCRLQGQRHLERLQAHPAQPRRLHHRQAHQPEEHMALFRRRPARAGLAFVGDLRGGLGVSIKNFWQSLPAALEVHHAASPRRNSTRGSGRPTARRWTCATTTPAHGLDAAYEDVQPGFSTAYGVARTSELTLFRRRRSPPRRKPSRMAAGRRPAPAARLPRRSTPLRPASSACGACRTAPRRSRRPSRTGSTPCSRTTSKQVDERALVRLLAVRRLHALVRRRRGTCGTTTGAATRGTTPNWGAAVALVQLPAHRPRGHLPPRRGADAQHERDGRLPSRSAGRPRLAPQRRQVGRRREGGPHQPGGALAALLLPHDRRAHRRHHARGAPKADVSHREIRSDARGRAAGAGRAGRPGRASASAPTGSPSPATG